MGRHQRIRVLGGVLAVAALPAALAVACGDSGPSAEVAAADTADTVCSLLRTWNNELTDSANATAKAITDDDDPETANDVLADGIDELVAIAEAHVDELGDIDLPDTPDRDRLSDDLRRGAEEAAAILERARDDVDDLPPITLERQPGAIGGLFVRLEGAQAAMEPAVGRYDDATLRAAFADDEGCRHVVQPG